MSSLSQSSHSDGRTERRDDNILLALRTAKCLFDEGLLVPSIEEVAKRSGLSPRSLYRYFEDRQTMVRQAIALVTREAYKLGAIDNIGVGPLATRIDAIVTSRIQVYKNVAGSLRASAALYPTENELVGAADRSLRLKMLQCSRQFEPELSLLDKRERVAVREACNMLLMMESIHVLHHRRGLEFDTIADVLSGALTKVLTPET
ncbi:MAG: TetR/AcrR family transcriptional regulator [Actinomycetota bacterium]